MCCGRCRSIACAHIQSSHRITRISSCSTRCIIDTKYSTSTSSSNGYIDTILSDKIVVGIKITRPNADTIKLCYRNTSYIVRYIVCDGIVIQCYRTSCTCTKIYQRIGDGHVCICIFLIANNIVSIDCSCSCSRNG